jgi:uncharacterized protein (TIGR03067 family)
MLTFVVLLSSLVMGYGDDATAKKDLEKLQGEWAMVSGEHGGMAIPEEFKRGFTRSAKGNETTLTMNGQVYMKAKFTLDPAKSPKAIDYEVNEGQNQGKKMLGIYAIEGGTVKFCFGQPDQERPKEFKTKQGDNHVLSVWKKK